ncbi:MAG TPA: FdhF/YdeP family oxidoreductase [Polyangiaceae bacterium]|nr:FdhF/YdeP family oxidoreductase [Polyangiaceae bacterium]
MSKLDETSPGPASAEDEGPPPAFGFPPSAEAEPLSAGRPAAAAEPPLEPEAPRAGAAPEGAGGLGAIASTMRHALGQMGVARTFRTLARINQKGGFDCQSCAWPDDDGERDVTAFCENGAKAVADEATLARATPEFFARHGVEELGRQTDHWLNAQGRLTHPMLLDEGATHYRPLAWAEAFDLVARELGALASPDEAIFYTSGRTSNEAAFLYQLFVREFGTNNLPDCSNMCHESSGVALNESLGVGKGTVTLGDFDLAEVIVVIGQNPGTNHPRMLTALQRAKRRGCFIITMNPLPEAGLKRFKHPQEVFDTLFGQGTALTDLFLQVRVGGDMAALRGIMKELIERDARAPGSAVDRAFARERADGLDELEASLASLSWAEIVEKSGLPREALARAADALAGADRIIACWAMGLTQHKHAVATIQDVVNLLLLRGAVGKPGAGACPVRGHSNVQGDRTMGIYEKPPAAFLDALKREVGFEPPRRHGLDTVAAIGAMLRGEAKVFFALGGNFLSAAPDTARTAEALRRCRLTAHVSTKLNRSHLVAGRRALILPCLGRTEVDRQASGEQLVSCENSMGVVQSSRGTLPPASEHLLSEPAIVAGLARRTLGARSKVDWAALASDYDRVRDLIERVVPGFEKYNERVRRPGGFYLPNAARDGTFRTATGRARFRTHPLEAPETRPGELLLMTIRSHDQFNTTVYGLDDRYRGIYGGRRVVFVHPGDAEARGLAAGDLVDLVGREDGGEARRARAFRLVPFPVARGCAAAYFPEANVLVPLASVAERSNTPASKSVPITLERAEG